MEQVTPSGLNITDLGFFLNLPTELQCTILEYSIDLRTLTALLGSGPEYRNLAQDCVRHLAPRSGVEAQEIPAELVISLPYLISSKYPIVVKSYQEIIALAQHPNLRFATFHVAELAKTTAFQAFLASKPENINVAAKYFFNYRIFWFLPLFTQYLFQEESCPSTCSGEPDYLYTFKINQDRRIVFDNNHLIIPSPEIAKLVVPIFATSSICSYQGRIEAGVKEKLFKLPCLKQINTGVNELSPEDYLDFEGRGYRVRFLKLLKLWQDKRISSDYFNRINTFLTGAQPLPQAKSFLPVNLDQLNQVDRVFPNLQTLNLLIRTHDLVNLPQLAKYQRVVLYNEDPNKKILIPQNLKKRIFIAK